MATYWSSGMDRLRAAAFVLVALALVMPVEAAGPKNKRQRHAAGYSFELPDGWTFEAGSRAVVVLPKGVKVDPDREDNPEVYTIWPGGQGEQADGEFVAGFRERLAAQGAAVDPAARPEAFGRFGTIHTFDFVHPARKVPFRVRIFSMQAKGKTIALVASGLKEKVASRDRTLREIAASLDYDR
jgi:hypothetical protein